jgi:para-nitrobenzyl esterase
VSAQGRPVYEYYFTKDNRGLGSNHAGELRYVYGNLDHYPGNYDGTDKELSQLMMQAWVSFVKTGDPNCDALTAKWQLFAEAPDKVYEFGLHSGPVKDPYRELYDLIDLEQTERQKKSEEVKKDE